MDALRVPFAVRPGPTRRDRAAVLPGFRRIAHLAIVFGLASGASRSARATWTNQPSVNLPVTTAAAGAFGPRVVSDGTGGVIVAWIDGRDGEVYAAHTGGD